MKRQLPWLLVAFVAGFLIFQNLGYQNERRREQASDTIEGQARILQDWLGLDETQTEAYLEFRNAIVGKEREFSEFRSADARAFLEGEAKGIPDEERLHLLKERHLAKLKEIKSVELNLWSRWIDTLTFDQRRQYLGKVFEPRPLDTSWYDRDFFDDL